MRRHETRTSIPQRAILAVGIGAGMSQARFRREMMPAFEEVSADPSNADAAVTQAYLNVSNRDLKAQDLEVIDHVGWLAGIQNQDQAAQDLFKRLSVAALMMLPKSKKDLTMNLDDIMKTTYTMEAVNCLPDAMVIKAWPKAEQGLKGMRQSLATLSHEVEEAVMRVESEESLEPLLKEVSRQPQQAPAVADSGFSP